MSDYPVEAIGHRLVVKIIKMEKETKGGIILADSITDRRDQAGDKGIIVDIGRNCWKSFDDGDAWARVGDKVLLKRYAGVVFDYRDDKYTIINDDEILAVINDDIDLSEIEL
jgi:co-chaperonin GroES (HSP10)